LAVQSHFDPDYLATRGPKGHGEPIDVWDDFAGDRNFDRHAGQHENILKIDDNKGCGGPDDPLITIDPTALRDRTIDHTRGIAILCILASLFLAVRQSCDPTWAASMSVWLKRRLVRTKGRRRDTPGQ